MRKITLRFPSILELIDFEMVALEALTFEVDRVAITITAAFSEQEISLARANHQASVVEAVNA
jgi:hypothetical protein